MFIEYKFCFLFRRPRRYFTLTQVLTVYKAQIRPDMNMICTCREEHSLASLDTFRSQQQNSVLSSSLKWISSWTIIEPFPHFPINLDTTVMFVLTIIFPIFVQNTRVSNTSRSIQKRFELFYHVDF